MTTQLTEFSKLILLRQEIRAVVPVVRSAAATYHVPALDSIAQLMQSALEDPKAAWDGPGVFTPEREVEMLSALAENVAGALRSVAATFHVPALDAQADRLQLVLDDPKAVWDDPADPPPAHPRHGGSSSYSVAPRAIRNPRGGEA